MFNLYLLGKILPLVKNFNLNYQIFDSLCLQLELWLVIFQLIVTVDSLMTRANALVINSSTVTINWKSLANRFYYIIK